MADDKSRSGQVIEACKRHKLARSALRRIRDLIRDFDSAGAADRRLAGFGITLLLLVIALTWLYYATAERASLY